MHMVIQQTSAEVSAPFPSTEPANSVTHLMFGELINVFINETSVNRSFSYLKLKGS